MRAITAEVYHSFDPRLADGRRIMVGNALIVRDLVRLGKVRRHHAVYCVGSCECLAQKRTVLYGTDGGTRMHGCNLLCSQWVAADDRYRMAFLYQLLCQGFADMPQ